MKKNRLIRAAAFILALSALSGCGEFDGDVNKADYTVVAPKKNGGYEENDEDYENSDDYDYYVAEDDDEFEVGFDGAAETNDLYDDSDNAVDVQNDELSTDSVENVENSGENSADNADSEDNSSENSADNTLNVDYTNDNTDGIKATVSTEAYSSPADVSRRAKTISDNMTMNEKAAQLILARCPSQGAADLMDTYGFGGYTLYATDFADRDKISAKEFISGIIDASEITPFIAVDEEGGDVVRVSKYTAYRSEPFHSIKSVYAESGMDGIISDSAEKAQLLTSLGINMNLAPVADIATAGDYIYDRTAGCDAYTTGDIVKQIITTSGENGLMSCLKHFPGYGSNVDTHTGVAVDDRSLDDFRNNDLIPFKTGISSTYTPAVLVNHNIINCLDTVPASLSAPVHRLLREELGFDGVIVTDDLGMDAIKSYTGSTSPYVAGILSGNDLLCVSDPVTAYNDLTAAVNDGTLSEKVIDEHVQRVIQMKLDYGIIS